MMGVVVCACQPISQCGIQAVWSSHDDWDSVRVCRASCMSMITGKACSLSPWRLLLNLRRTGRPTSAMMSVTLQAHHTHLYPWSVSAGLDRGGDVGWGLGKTVPIHSRKSSALMHMVCLLCLPEFKDALMTAITQPICPRLVVC